MEEPRLIADMRAALAGRSVLEVCCGTGYWTERLVPAASIVAVDYSRRNLRVARAKSLPAGKVKFLQADAYALQRVPGSFDGGLTTFWISRVPKALLPDFLAGFHTRLGSGAVVFMADHVADRKDDGQLVRHPEVSDSFERRILADGSVHEVLKNCYTRKQLSSLLGRYTSALQLHYGRSFWWASYILSD